MVFYLSIHNDFSNALKIYEPHAVLVNSFDGAIQAKFAETPRFEGGMVSYFPLYTRPIDFPVRLAFNLTHKAFEGNPFHVFSFCDHAKVLDSPTFFREQRLEHKKPYCILVRNLPFYVYMD